MPINHADDYEIRLHLSEEKFQMLFEHSPVGMALVHHETGQFFEVNESLLKATGYTKEEFLSLSYWDITPKEYEQQELQQIVELNEKGKFGPNIKEYIRKDGSRYPIRIQGFILKDVDGKNIVWGIIEDISEIKKLEDELRQQAMFDYLTNTYNRRIFIEIMNKSVEQSYRTNIDLSIAMFDVDQFKEINDKYGHCVGDNILVSIANIVKSTIRKSDIICRWGGDEFIILFCSTSIEEAVQVIEKLRIKISEHNHEISEKISCSFGLTSLGISTPEKLIENVDIALYNAKNNGRNCVRIFN